MSIEVDYGDLKILYEFVYCKSMVLS